MTSLKNASVAAVGLRKLRECSTAVVWTVDSK